jgi:5'-3' exonuclease
MPYKYLILDMNNVYWRSVLSSFKNLTSLVENKEEEVNLNKIILPETFKRVEKIKERFGFQDSQVYLLFDNPGSAIRRRKQIYREYKHARDKKVVPPIFYRTLEFLETILQYYNNNSFVIRIDDYEADDLLAPLIKLLDINDQDQCLVVSADMDWARNINENTHWFNYLKVYDPKVFKEEYGFNPIGNKIQLYKAFHGDDSDNIPNAVPYCPKEVLLYLINKYDTLKNLLSAVLSIQEIPLQWRLKIKEAENQLKTNYLLADFLPLDEDIRDYTMICEENIPVLKYWFNFLDIPFEARMYDPAKDDFFQAIK